MSLCAQDQPLWDDASPELELAVMTRSNKDVEKAGDFLRANPESSEHASEMLLAVSEWRSAHELALKRVMTGLRKHVGSHGWWEVNISGRTKRIRSIVAKLRRQPRMSLTQMQDIGGCRAILGSVGAAELLAESLRGSLGQSLSAGGEISEKNYIAHPKTDGYRSIHFVVRYLLSKPENMKPRRIEIQIRSRLQHQWATALETVDLFTGQTLKAGSGDPQWQRFFSLASSVLAFQEKRPSVPNTPPTLPHCTEEMKALAKELCVVDRLQAWSRVMRDTLQTPKKNLRNIYCYLVDLDVEKHQTVVTPYYAEELKLAHAEYLAREKENSNRPNRSTVLVTAYSLDEVHDAFPGFYGDTKAFLRSAGLTV